MEIEPFGFDALGERFIEQNATATDETAGPGEGAMPCDEVALRHAIAIEKDYVIAT